MIEGIITIFFPNIFQREISLFSCLRHICGLLMPFDMVFDLSIKNVCKHTILAPFSPSSAFKVLPTSTRRHAALARSCPLCFTFVWNSDVHRADAPSSSQAEALYFLTSLSIFSTALGSGQFWYHTEYSSLF